VTGGAGVRPPAARVARNTTLRITAEVISKITSVAFFVVLAREFSASGLGDWIFAMAVVQLLWPVAGFGLDRLMIREIARDRSALHRLFFPAMWLKVAANLGGVVVALGVLTALGYSDTVWTLVLVMGVSQCVGMAMTSAFSVFQAYEQMEYHFLASVPKGVLSSLAGMGVVLLGGGLVEVALTGFAFNVFGAAFSFLILYRRFVAPRFAVGLREWPRLYVTSGPLGIQEVIGIIIFRIDAILLSLMTTAAVVGIYGAGYRMLEATLFLAWSVGTAVFPMYSYFGRDTRPPLSRVYEGSLKFALAIMTPVGVTLLVCAEPIVDVLFGLPEYADTVPVLRWLALVAVFYPIGYLSGELIAVRRPGRFAVLSSAFVAGFNIALNLVLIPIYGAEGAAATTLASEAVLAVLGIALARAETGMPRLAWVLLAPGIAGTLMAASMLPFANDLVLAIVIGAPVYLAALALAEGKGLRGDIAAVRQAVRRGTSPSVTAEEAHVGS
jgi:O-antigen/teichoic acid export membrane protein